MPDVTICIAAFNAAETIEQTVRSALAQTVPVDVVVVDDGSTDETALRAFPEGIDPDEATNLRIVQIDHQGRAPAHNAAWQAAETPWCYFLGADDWIDPDAISSILGAIAAVSGDFAPTMAYGDIELHDRFGEPRANAWAYRQMTADQMRAHFLNNGQSPVPANAACLWRRDVLETLGGFRAPICTDTEMLQRALELADFLPVHVPGARYHYRWSPLRVRTREKAEQTVKIYDQLGQRDALAMFTKWLAWWRNEAGEPFLERARALDPEKTDEMVERVTSRGSPPTLALIAQPEDGGGHFARAYGRHLHRRGVDVIDSAARADILFVEWCASMLEKVSRSPKFATILARLHSYEAFTDAPLGPDWEQVDALGFVNRKVEEIVFDRFSINVPTVSLPNGIDGDLFRIPPGKQWREPVIGFLGHMSHKKGPGLLAQILCAIPEATFRIGGRFDDPRFELYLREMFRHDPNVVFEGPVDDVHEWLRDKTFILSTSPFESFGQGIAEAVASGCLPLVHDWPGSEEHWGFVNRFRTVDEAALEFQRLRALPEAQRATEAQNNRAETLVRHGLSRSLAALDRVIDTALEQPGPDIIVAKEKRFLRHQDEPDFVEAKRKAHRKPPGIQRVLVHMPPNGGFRYIQQNYALAFEALGYDVRVMPFEAIDIPEADLLLTAWSDFFILDRPDAIDFPGVVIASAGAYRDCAEIVESPVSPPEDWVYWTPVVTMPERDDYPNLHHLPYAALPTVHRHQQVKRQADYAFVGTINQTKGGPTSEWVLPLADRHTMMVRGVGWGEGVPDLPQNQAGLLYNGARICPNVHQEIQRTGSRPMLNERTYVIPSCGGFELCDAVSVLRDTFAEDEMLAAETPAEMALMGEELLHQPLMRRDVALRGHHRVLATETYFDRVTEMMGWLA